MNRGRRVFCLLASMIVLTAQLYVGNARSCSMCGASCRCASRAAADSCCVRAVGCGGAIDGAATGAVQPLRAVLVEASLPAPFVRSERVVPASSPRPHQPDRAPLDRPPRISC